ncbi:MAG: tetratricopeptide repeat protein [Chloroflexi bacterium]|nr:tetratricopeptide repeat protein [Chloroflexota bacterium]
MTESKTFHDAIEAIKNEEPGRAREILTRLLRSDKENPEYWLLLSSVVESRKEKIYCLQTVLKFDATNHTALRGLRILGAGYDFEEIEPIHVMRRIWDVEIAGNEEEKKGFARIWANRLWRILIFASASVGVFTLLLIGIFGMGRKNYGHQLTVTPLAWTETPSPTVTNTPLVRTPTSTPSVVEPLWMQLEVTYTPRPVYVNTPHPGIEAYRIGMRRYADEDYETMLVYMEQAARLNPSLVDVHYYLGEAYRLMGDYEQALAAYENAIDLDSEFAPVYVARALAQLIEDEDANVEGDFTHALELDPNFETAYLLLADYWLEHDEPQFALDVLANREELLGENPRYYLLQAQALLEQKQFESALAHAINAYQGDITNLQVYILLAQIYFEIDEFEVGLPYLKTYGLYQNDDPMYFALLGRSYYERDYDYESVAAVLDKALNLDDELAIAYEYRGLAAIAAGNGKQAVNDLYRARNLEPRSFSISLNFGLALWSEERLEEASAQLRASTELAKSDIDLGKAYYHVARLATEVGPLSRAIQYWNYLLDLPEGAVPEEWLLEAHLYFNPPTVTSTPTKTSTSTLTPTSTVTPTATEIPLATENSEE